MDEYTIRRFERYVVSRIACEGLTQIDTDYLEFSVLRFPKDLGIGKQRFRRRSARQINCITQIGTAIGDMLAGLTHLTAHRDHRSIFEIEPAEHADCVERLERDAFVLSGHSISEIEGQHYRRKIWGI